MYLVDTNIFLEVLLVQRSREKAKRFLECSDRLDLFVTDYSLHSIGVILLKRRQHEKFADFVDDMILNAGLTEVNLTVEDLLEVPEVARRFGVDFDDAYQYVAASQNDLEIVSFDSDFDVTDRGRLHPEEVLGRINDGGSSR